MRVWRIEHARDPERGPYQDVDGECLASYGAPEHQPGPGSDGIYFWDFDPSYYFGFASIEQARSWLREDQQVQCLAKHWYVIGEYEVPKDHVLEGKHQVAFRLDRAKPRGKHPIVAALAQVDERLSLEEREVLEMERSLRERRTPREMPWTEYDLAKLFWEVLGFEVVSR